MKRYIIRPRSPAAAPAAEAAALSIVEALSDSGAEMVKADAITGQHVVKLSEADAAALAASRPDLLVEEDTPIDLFRVPGLPEIVPQADQVDWQVRVKDSNGAAIENCTIFAIGRQFGFRADTDQAGTARLSVPPGAVERIICSPRHDHWSRVVRPPAGGASILDVSLDRLDPAAATAWVHRLVGSARPNGPTGRGVSVCVVDSGIAPVAPLAVTGGINTLDGGDPAHWNVDEKGHGTHVAGIIAGRPTEASAFRGIAPDATLYSAKVFPGGFYSDLIEAVDWSRLNGIDLVNLSLGARTSSAALGNAITLAVNAGVTIVAATGNDAAPVAFPARHPDVIAVGAIGRLGSFPADSGHSLKIGWHRDWFGGLFSASFTNFGAEVDTCAPGVGIASTVPTGFAAWDGTSMACPVVTGLLALALETAPWLRTGTRTTRDLMAWLVTAGAAPTGLPQEVGGAGLLTYPKLLAAIRSVGG